MDAVKDLIIFQIERHFKGYAKEMLCRLEELKESGDNINEDNYPFIRKRVLDGANDRIRELSSIMSKFDIEIKKD